MSRLHPLSTEIKGTDMYKIICVFVPPFNFLQSRVAFWRLQMILLVREVGLAVKDLTFSLKFSYCYPRNEPASRSSHTITPELTMERHRLTLTFLTKSFRQTDNWLTSKPSRIGLLTLPDLTLNCMLRFRNRCRFDVRTEYGKKRCLSSITFASQVGDREARSDHELKRHVTHLAYENAGDLNLSSKGE